MSTYRAPRKPYRANSASVMGKGSKKYDPPGFAQRIAGKPSSPQGGRGKPAPLHDPLHGGPEKTGF
jgi:hypothetical protein